MLSCTYSLLQWRIWTKHSRTSLDWAVLDSRLKSSDLNSLKAFMYTASILLGIGASVIWVAQGEFLHLQSPNDQTMMRNTGIFWCIFQLRIVFITDRCVEWKWLLLQLIAKTPADWKNSISVKIKKSHYRKSLHLPRMEWEKWCDQTGNKPTFSRRFHFMHGLWIASDELGWTCFHWI